MPAGDLALWSDVANAVFRPVGRLVAVGTQALPDAVATALDFTGEDWDTGSFHSTVTNPSRVTPTVAGVYRVFGTVFMSALIDGVTVDALFRKNGATNLAPAGRLGGAAAHTVTTSGSPSVIGGGNAFAIPATAQIAVNGTTDYWELVVQPNSAAADATNQSAQFSSVMEWEFLRPPI